MGHSNRLEEEDDGYEGCSEGESDVDLTSHPQVQLLWCTLYSVRGVLVAASVAIALVSLCTLSGWKTH